MRVMKLVSACLVVSAMVVVVAFAQEGHPLRGSWVGDYGLNKTSRTPVFVVLEYDGKDIKGTLNPGTDNIPLTVATMTPPPPPPPAPPRAGGGGGAGGAGGQGGGGRGNRGARGDAGGGQNLGNQVGAPPPANAGPPVPPPPRPEWLVHFEGEGKDRNGNVVKHVIDGKIINVSLPKRHLAGTWTVGTTKNDFELIRQ
jgi:hypothetical protein